MAPTEETKLNHHRQMKRFTSEHIVQRSLDYLYPSWPTDFVYRPLAWQRAGLQQTQSGYGFRLTTEYMLHYNGRLHRVYTTQYSNVGSSYILSKGGRIYLA